MAPSSSAAIHTPPGLRELGGGAQCAIVHLKPRVVWTRRFSKNVTGLLHHAVSHRRTCHSTVATRLLRRGRRRRCGCAIGPRVRAVRAKFPSSETRTPDPAKSDFPAELEVPDWRSSTCPSRGIQNKEKKNIKTSGFCPRFTRPAPIGGAGW